MTYFYIANILGADLSINNFNELNDEKIFVTLKKIKETRKSFDFTPKTRDDYNIIPFLLILMCLLNGKSNINN
jgi:hypothetical protein